MSRRDLTETVTSLLLLFLFFGGQSVRGQNLVPNGDFEQYNECPQNVGGFMYSPQYDSFPTVKNWVSLTPGTPDYYNRCADSATMVSIPWNMAGYQMAHSGKAYGGLVGFGLFSTTPEYYREMVATKLSARMMKDSFYCVRFYVSPTYNQQFQVTLFVDEIGAHFSDTLPHSFDLDVALPYHVLNDTSRRMTDTSAWYEIRGTYRAKGGEQWMTIGSFGNKNYKPRITSLANDTAGYSYVYLDDVSVTLASQNTLSHHVNGCKEGFRVSLASSKNFGSYSWNTGATTQSIVVKDTGTYTCLAEDNCGVIYDVFYVTLPEVPSIKDTSICMDTEGPELAPDDTSLLWYKYSTSVVGAHTQPTVNTGILGKTVLYVARKVGACISDKKAVTITVIGPPLEHPLAVADRCHDGADTSVEIGVSEAPNTNYKWNNGEDGCCFKATTDGVFIRTATNRCGSTNDTVYVHPVTCTHCAIFPDAFTPNGDGHNDDFGAIIRCPVKDFYMSVFSRWGQAVFTSDDQRQRWTGNYHGVPAPAGTYMYFASFKHALTGEAFTVKGAVNLVR